MKDIDNLNLRSEVKYSERVEFTRNLEKIFIYWKKKKHYFRISSKDNKKCIKQFLGE